MGSKQTIEGFYREFAALDAAGMSKRYAAGAMFSDPVFGTLKGERIGAMWRMLCAQASGLKVELKQVSASGNGKSAQATWEARYSYSKTGKKVVNVVKASFEFDEKGLIIDHRDDFDLTLWARQALGVPGIVLGWTPWMQEKIKSGAASSLAAYEKLSGQSSKASSSSLRGISR